MKNKEAFCIYPWTWWTNTTPSCL